MPDRRSHSLDEVVLNRIDELREEIAELALALGNAYCPPGHEDTGAAVVTKWLDLWGIPYKVISETKERPTVVGRVHGTQPDDAQSLLFNSHLDCAVNREEDHLRMRDPLDPKYTTAWREGDRLYGYGILNDKGPMACWMVAAKAISEVAPLRGDLILTMVAGEIGQAPVDEFQGPRYYGTGYGTRQVIASGIRADHVLVAETTDFAPSWVEAGKANYRIVVLAGPSRYTPHIPRPVPLELNPNAIVRAAPLVLALETWAVGYQERNTRQYECGTMIPKVNFGAIRSGVPYNLERVPEVCRLYLDVRTVPSVDPESIRHELCDIASAVGVEATVELTSYHEGAESPRPSEMLEALQRAHEAEFKVPMKAATPVMLSMWRDIIPFALAGMPALTYGPSLPAGGRDEYFADLNEFVKAAKIYARLALDLCNCDRQQAHTG